MSTKMNAALAELRAAINDLARESKTLGFVRANGHPAYKAERCHAAAQARVESAITAAFAVAQEPPAPAGCKIVGRISDFPEMQEALRKGLADGTMHVS